MTAEERTALKLAIDQARRAQYQAGSKCCIKCGEMRPPADYYPNPARERNTCKHCMNLRRREWREKNREHENHLARLRRRGAKSAEYNLRHRAYKREWQRMKRAA